MDTERTQEYLEAIYKRQQDETPVITSSLAEDLKVSQPAITDMLRSLESRGLINYTPGKGAYLTSLGNEKALGVIRRHRLWERFLTDVLGMEWDKVHDQACLLEHVTSPEVEEKLADLLGNVDTCPHGHSIPDKDGHIKKEDLMPLTEFTLGEKLILIRVNKEDAALLSRLDRLGLQPPAVVRIISKNKNGAIEVEIGSNRIELDRETAIALLARPYKEEKESKAEEMPLSQLLPGQTGVIKAIEGGRGKLGRCFSLGFTPGTRLKMLENYSRGPVLVKLHDTEVALGRKMANHVIVVKDNHGS